MDDDPSKSDRPGAPLDGINRELDDQIDKVGRVVAGQSEEESAGLSGSSLIAVPVDTVPMGIALPCKIYIRVAGRFLLFRAQGERLSTKRALSLQAKGADSLYIHRAAWQVFLSALEKLELPEPITPESASQHLRNLIVAYGLELERKIKEPKRPMFDKLQKLCESLAAVIRSNPGVGTRLLRKNENPQLVFVTHAVNSAIYAAVIGYKMNFSLEELQQMTYGGLVHDLGKLLIPKPILLKQSPLNAEERELMQAHTRRGAEVLQSMGAVPPVVLTALQHHERMDGKGYPGGLPGANIHPFARVCTIADAYDALTNTCATRAAMSPADALARMRTLSEKFDMKFLGAAVGPTPVKAKPG